MLLLPKLLGLAVAAWSSVEAQNCALPSAFYPIADNATTLPFGDDLSSGALLPAFPFRFYGRTKTQVFVNINGQLTFSSSFSDFTPDPLPTSSVPAMISAFWNDIQTTFSGCPITAEFTQNSTLLDRMQAQVGVATFRPREVFVVTWNRVGRYNSDYSVANTFQIVLGYSSLYTYVIFNYGELEVSQAAPCHGQFLPLYQIYEYPFELCYLTACNIVVRLRYHLVWHCRL
jgi:hypothetical protein